MKDDSVDEEDTSGEEPKLHHSVTVGLYGTSKLDEKLSISETAASIFGEALSNRRWRIFPLLAFTYGSCFMSSLSVTFTRSLSGMGIAETETSKFGGIMPKLLVVLILFNSVYSYYILNKCLKHYNTVYVVPLLKANDLFHNLLSGGVFLREFGEYTTKDFIIFMFGIVVCIVSMCLLLLGNEENEKRKAEEQKARHEKV